jgi:sugar/nucleoside kinase (ribokinase family)
MRILVLGDLILDSVAKLSFAPDGRALTGEDINVWMPDLTDCCGGSAFNFAAAAAKQGLDPVLVGCVGDDWAGEYLLQGIQRHGIEHVVNKTASRSTGRVLIAYFRDGSRVMLASRPSANDCLSDVSFDVVSKESSVDAVWVSGLCIRDRATPRYQTTLDLISAARAAGAKIIIDIVPHDFHRYFGTYKELVRVLGPIDGLASAVSSARSLFGLPSTSEPSDETLRETAKSCLEEVSFTILSYRSSNDYVQLAQNRGAWWDISRDELNGSAFRGYGDFKVCQALSRRMNDSYVWD